MKEKIDTQLKFKADINEVNSFSLNSEQIHANSIFFSRYTQTLRNFN